MSIKHGLKNDCRVSFNCADSLIMNIGIKTFHKHSKWKHWLLLWLRCEYGKQCHSFIAHAPPNAIATKVFQFTFINNQQKPYEKWCSRCGCCSTFAKILFSFVFLIVCFHFHSFIYTFQWFFILPCSLLIRATHPMKCMAGKYTETMCLLCIASASPVLILPFSHINSTFQIIFKDDKNICIISG